MFVTDAKIGDTLFVAHIILEEYYKTSDEYLYVGEMKMKGKQYTCKVITNKNSLEGFASGIGSPSDFVFKKEHEIRIIYRVNITDDETMKIYPINYKS